MIKVILWDVDGTLLNFLAAEREALRGCFAEFGLGELTDERLARYSAINRKYWQMLERGEISKPQVLRGRFEEFFASEGLPCPDTDALNGRYQILLGDTVVFQDNAYELVKQLKGRVEQYAVTNGTAVAQERKLNKSGLIHLLDGVFISEQVGVEKPDKRFFDRVFEEIGRRPANEVLIVGDSLTSDMAGGNNAGIRCCWYNPAGAAVPEGLSIQYNIQNLWELDDILRDDI